MRILFLEPFYGGSHGAFADGLRAHSAHEIVLHTLPAERWRSRMRRGSQELALSALDLPGEFDAIVATSMLDLPAFLALTRRRFAQTPVLLYMHENQFTYPRIKGEKLNSWFGQINYASALAADHVAFNSAFHRDDFLRALRWLETQPNNWLLPAAADMIAGKASLLPIGMDLARFDAWAEDPADDPPIILWNHRWEFDKEPAVFARAVLRLAELGASFRVAVAGEPGEAPAPELDALRGALGERLVHFGYADSFADYARLLWRSRIAVSTSRQEFFGIAMAEAMYCRCHPVAPARLNYPYLIPEALHPNALFHSEDDLVALLARLLHEPIVASNSARAAVAPYDWRQAIAEWDLALERVCRVNSREPRV